MRYSALCFDLDGTLINSIPLWEEAIQYMFSTVGITVTHEDFLTTYAPVAQHTTWLRKYDVDPAQEDQLRIIRNAHYIALLRERITWCPGALDLLIALQGKLPLALITNSHTDWVDASDAHLSLRQYFAAVLTADDMGDLGKPHPHGFLLAADRMNADPKQCVNIGDMDIDVEGPHRAGMQAIVIPGPFTSKQTKEKADAVYESLEQLRGVLLSSL